MNGKETPKRPPRLKSVRELTKNKIKVVNEFIETERTYVDNLELVLKLFVEKFSNGTLVSPSECRVLFGEIRSIRLISQAFCDHFKKRDIIGAFESLTPFLKLYCSYARNFPGSQKMLTKLMSQREFQNLVHEQEDLPEMKGLKLPALLILPIQRIPRYNLLISELIKHCWEEGEMRQLREIQGEVSKVAEFVNDCIGEYDQSQKIVALQKSLDSAAPKLLVPGRKLLKEGVLRKRNPDDLSQYQERFVWLFNDIVMYGKRNLAKRDNYITKCVMPVRHCTVERVPGCNCFELTCKGETLFFCADSYTVMDDWVNEFEDAISTARTDRQTLRKESSRRMPMKRHLLAKAKRRSSSLTCKFNRRLKGRENSPTPKEGNGFRSKLLLGLQQAFARKRKGASPPPFASETPIKRRCTTTSVKPRLSTVDEESSLLATPEISVSKRTPIKRYTCENNNTYSGNRQPWWSEYEQGSGQHSSKQKWCTFM